MNHTRSDLRILIRGANDVGSAVAHRLFTAGYSVVIHEMPMPTTPRRRMSFTDAVFDGYAILEDVEAELVRRMALLDRVMRTHQVIPVVVKDFDQLIQRLHPQILVDARMRKHSQPEAQVGLADLTIGLGPNFVAGETTDLAIETSWGESLGRIIVDGPTNQLQGEPQEVDGHGRDRYIYAPIAGTFYTSLEIGNPVHQGQQVARIESTPLLAPITGVLRGLTHDGVPVVPKTKIIEVDPRRQGAQVSGIGERSARISEGVFTTIQNWETNHVH